MRSFLLIFLLFCTCSLAEHVVDPNGYVMFCPCMGKDKSIGKTKRKKLSFCRFFSSSSSGRFGNQAEQFLGAMGFTHRLNRTLVLPHWIEYPSRSATSVKHLKSREKSRHFRWFLKVQIPFDRYFQVEPLEKYLRVILMEDFMNEIAEKIWPKGKRFGRFSSVEEKNVEIFVLFSIVFCYTSQDDENSPKRTCRAKEGNPFGPYWNRFDIDFDGDIFYQPLYFDVPTPEPWDKK